MAFLGYLLSLVVVGGLAGLAVLFIGMLLAGGEDPPWDMVLSVWTLVMAFWTWFYFWIARRRLGKQQTDMKPARDIHQETGLLQQQHAVREASDPAEDSVEKRREERRRDNIRSVPLLLNFYPLTILGAVAIPPVAFGIESILKALIPATPDYIGTGLMIFGYAFGLQWFIQWRARRLMFKTSTGRMVLWLRRFHEDGYFPFELFLEDTLRGIALPVTVQDTTVAGSQDARSMNPKALIPASITFGIFITTVAALMAGLGPQILFIAIPLAIISVTWSVYQQRAAATNDLRTEEGRKRIDTLMHLLESDEKIPNALTTFRMSDKNWKGWVGDFIERADAVVMDITHLTESLGWEVHTCQEYIKPRQMILACGKYDDTPGDPWPPLLARLEQMVGPDFVAGCQRFTYDRPRKKPFTEKIQPGLRVVRARNQRKIHETEFLKMIDIAFAREDSKDKKPGLAAHSG